MSLETEIIKKATEKKSIRTPEKNPLWYKGGVIYELHVRAYADSDGDDAAALHDFVIVVVGFGKHRWAGGTEQNAAFGEEAIFGTVGGKPGSSIVIWLINNPPTVPTGDVTSIVVNPFAFGS